MSLEEEEAEELIVVDMVVVVVVGMDTVVVGLPHYHPKKNDKNWKKKI
mgnify:CR=1 FL=1